MTVRRKLIKIFKSKETVDYIVSLNSQLLDLFLKNLPKHITTEELVRKWGGEWKHIESDDFLCALDEITKQALGKVKNLDDLIIAWFSTIHPRLRWHLKNRILVSLKIKQINLDAEQVLVILKSRKIKFSLKQAIDLTLIIKYQNYPQK